MVGNDEKGFEWWPLVKVRSFSSSSLFFPFTTDLQGSTNLLLPRLIPLPSPFKRWPLVSMIFFLLFFFLLLMIYKGQRISYYHNKSPTTIYHPCDEQWVDESPTAMMNLLLPQQIPYYHLPPMRWTMQGGLKRSEWRPLVKVCFFFFLFFFFLLLMIYKGRRISYYHNESPTTIYHPCDEQCT